MIEPIQTNLMQGLIDWDAIMPMDRYAGGHDEQMQALFKNAKVIAHWNEGDYQGTVATCVELPSGQVVVYNDYYGSCSGCDAWEGASDEDVRKLCIDLANNAKIFESIGDALKWMDECEDHPYGGTSWVKELAKKIRENRK